jgi:hypothetical protein
MSEGTSLEDIETGNIANTADDAVMNAILSDMNAIEEPQVPVYTPPPPQQPPQPQFPQLPPPPYQQPDPFPQQYQPEPHYFEQHSPQSQYQQQAQQQAIYEAVEEPVPTTSLKKNSWSLLFQDLHDPLFVGLLVTLFSLPALHTWLAKRLSWAYKVGGSLSWIGFLLQFALVAGIFVTYRQIMRVMDGVA